MGVKFVTIVNCDGEGCTKSAQFDTILEYDRGCSPFGGPMCEATMQPDIPISNKDWYPLYKNNTWKYYCQECLNKLY